MSRYQMCPDCGRRLRRVRNLFGDWDGESYVCDYCSRGYYDDDIPEGCRACGGPYPDCINSCDMFDD